MRSVEARRSLSLPPFERRRRRRSRLLLVESTEALRERLRPRRDAGTLTGAAGIGLWAASADIGNPVTGDCICIGSPAIGAEAVPSGSAPLPIICIGTGNHCMMDRWPPHVGGKLAKRSRSLGRGICGDHVYLELSGACAGPFQSSCSP